VGFWLNNFEYIDHPLFWGRQLHFHQNEDFYNPAKIAPFSKIIGDAIGDMFARRISGAKYTHIYEDALRERHQVCTGPRPDFYCDTGEKQFALEVKGRTEKSFSDNKMEKVKKQAGSGKLSVDFYIACVTYSIFDYQIKVKYYDPENEFAEYDRELAVILARKYYSQILSETLKLQESENRTINGIECEAYALDNYGLINCKLLISKSIRNWLNFTGTNIHLPEMKKYEEEFVFLDNDGVGIEIDWPLPNWPRQINEML
jgi:hypothetical protein